MKKPTEKDWVSTSFHNVTFKATPQELKTHLGEPDFDDNDGTDKVNLEWNLMTEDEKTFFTIYDWKKYRPLKMTEKVEWHIVGKTEGDTIKAGREIMKALGRNINLEKMEFNLKTDRFIITKIK